MPEEILRETPNDLSLSANFLFKKKGLIEKIENNKKEKITHKKLIRRSKLEKSGRNFRCKLCQKSYLSYAAMYLHLKKKHNIILQDLKQNYFSRYNMSNKKLSNNPYAFFDEKFSIFYKNQFNEIYINNLEYYSEFLENTYISYEKDPIFKKVFEFKKLLTSTNSLKKFQMGHLNSLNDAFALYLFWQWGKKDENTLKIITQIIFLFRDFLNRFAWELVEDYQKKNLDEELIDIIHKKSDEEFTNSLNKNYLPFIIDDFISPYLTNKILEDTNFKSAIKSTIFEVSKILQEENLIDFIAKPLEF